MKLLMLGLAFVALSSADKITSTSCPCGWTNRDRIVGGKETTRNEFPLIGALVLMAGDSQQFCGAAILTPYHALTAAHCAQDDIRQLLPYIKLLVGAHSVKEFGSGTQVIPVEKMINHENYQPKDPDGNLSVNDISLLVLGQKIRFTQNVGPACLPTGPLDLEYEHIKVLGWGMTSTGGESSDVLRKAGLRVIPYDRCASLFRLNPERTQFCSFDENKDSCKGDSGGPLIWLDPSTNRYTLVGLVSYGTKQCGTKPAVNTDVTRYIDWIKTKITESGKPGITCQKVTLEDLYQ